MHRLLFFIFIPCFVYGQQDTTGLFKQNEKEKKLGIYSLPPRTFMIKSKDLEKLKIIERKHVVIIDDTSAIDDEEFASGLSEDELAAYKKNKKEMKLNFNPPPDEEKTYPTLSTIRKILKAAEFVGCLIILVLSLK